jgi:LCP family protein required for cell wall assembly
MQTNFLIWFTQQLQRYVDMDVQMRSSRLASKYTWLITGIAVILFAIASLGIFQAVRFMQSTGLTPQLGAKLLFNDGITLSSTNDRTNVLILGIGGGDHQGGDLTDTMIMLSLDSNKRSAALISIPRDIWSDTLRDKVNTAYHYGEEKEEGSGMLLAKIVAEDVVGMPIHYSLLIDFSGFKDIVDLLGGIDVNVSRAFTDNEYPIPGKEHETCPDDPTNRCLYETIHFDSGIQHMNGERALTYVRSRHAEGEEGGDFARNRRQQEVLIALKDTVVNPFRWVTLDRLTALPTVIDRAIDTDMNIGELATVLTRYTKINEENVKKISFDTLLTEGPRYLYNNLYVLVPLEDWASVQTYIADEL